MMNASIIAFEGLVDADLQNIIMRTNASHHVPHYEIYLPAALTLQIIIGQPT